MTGNCQRCDANEVVSIQAHARDCFYVVYPDGEEHDGYFPESLPELGRGDDMHVQICMNCGQVQGNFNV